MGSHNDAQNSASDWLVPSDDRFYWLRAHLKDISCCKNYNNSLKKMVFVIWSGNPSYISQLKTFDWTFLRTFLELLSLPCFTITWPSHDWLISYESQFSTRFFLFFSFDINWNKLNLWVGTTLKNLWHLFFQIAKRDLNWK